MTQSLCKSQKPSVIQVFHGQKKTIIFSTLNDEFTVPCGDPIIINAPITSEELGINIVCVMKQLPHYTKADIRPNLITDVTGVRNLRRLTKEYHFLTISWPVDDALYFELYSGESDGSYSPTSFCKKLPANASAKEIGDCVLELFSNTK